MIEEIEKRLGQLRTSEKKVASVVLSDPKKSIFYSVNKLARLANVSDPTVIRFCRALGYEGYTAFKVQLAQSLGSYPAFLTAAVQLDDSFANIAGKMISNSMSELQNLSKKIDLDTVEKAVSALARARRIELYGQGASGIVAEDAEHKLMRVGIPVHACKDSHVHCMSAITLTKNDVLVAISHTGRSHDIISSTRLAKKSGARIISITSGRSPLSQLADIALFTHSQEDTYTYIPMTSRINDLQVIDLLAVGLAVKKGKRVQKMLIRSKEVLYDKYLTD